MPEYSSQSQSFEGGSVRRSHASDNDGSLWEDDPAASPGEAYQPPKKRIYYADWTRAIAIQLVIFIHCLCNSADASGFDPEMSPGAQQKKDGIVKSLVQIGIPMFFYISGMAMTFYNTEAKGFGVFLGEKSLRLLVPFIAAIFIFLIPRLYFGQQYEDWCRPDGETENDYWAFQSKTLPDVPTKLSWLWYLPALFIDIVLTYPLVAWTVRRSRKIPFNQRDDGNIILLQLALFVVWLFPAFYLDTKKDFGTRYLLPSSLTMICVMFCFYTFQLLIPTENGDKYAMLIKIIGPLGGIALNYWKTQEPNMSLHHLLMMVNYDAVFFSQGCVDQLYFKQMLRTRGKIGKTTWAPITVLAAILLYALSSPQNYTQVGFLFFYPLYSDYTMQCLYTTGTWMWLTFVVWTMQAIANKKFNDTAYKYVAGSALYAYVSHYFFIVIWAVFIIRPYQITFIPALFLDFFLTDIVIFVSYAVFVLIWELVFPPKTTALEKEEEERQALLKNQEVMVGMEKKDR